MPDRFFFLTLEAMNSIKDLVILKKNIPFLANISVNNLYPGSGSKNFSLNRDHFFIFHQKYIFEIFYPNFRHHALYFSDNINWAWRHPLVEKNLKKGPGKWVFDEV